jgi:SAM-dependent methyltransferase
MADRIDPKRIVADGYDRMGVGFSEWNSRRPPEGHRWFLDQVLRKVPEDGDVLELGCGPGTDAGTLSAGRRYVGLDLSLVQLRIASERLKGGRFVCGDLVSAIFKRMSFDAIVALYVFNHVPQRQVDAAFRAAYGWLRPGGRLMLGGLPTFPAPDRVEEWLGVEMFFAGIEQQAFERSLRAQGFSIETSEVRFATQEEWGLNEPQWIIARRPGKRARQPDPS